MCSSLCQNNFSCYETQHLIWFLYYDHLLPSILYVQVWRYLGPSLREKQLSSRCVFIPKYRIISTWLFIIADEILFSKIYTINSKWDRNGAERWCRYLNWKWSLIFSSKLVNWDNCRFLLLQCWMPSRRFCKREKSIIKSTCTSFSKYKIHGPIVKFVMFWHLHLSHYHYLG